MGAVFGVSTVLGPLLGGLFVDHLSWRWIFYVNVPIGIAAFVVLQIVLATPAVRIKRTIDYLGMALLAGGLTSIVLYTSLGGSTYPWWSAQMILLLVLSIVLSVGFVVAERYAKEPTLPLSLFSNRVFTVASIVGFIVGFALFGSVTYIPLYLQVVRGASPTQSGLEMLPLMAGVLIASIGSGQLISRAGRYKIFPIVGTGLMVVGMLLLARLTPDDLDAARRPLHGRARPRPRLRDAGADPRRPERRRLPRSRRRHRERDALPVDGRDDRRADLRRHLHQSVREQARIAAATRCRRADPLAPRPGADRQAAAGDSRSRTSTRTRLRCIRCS